MKWQERGLCTHPSVQPRDFSPVDPGTGHPDLDKARSIATRICGPCPVRAQCLAYAHELADLGLEPQEMVWAGWWWPAKMWPAAPRLDLLVADDREGAAA